MTAEEKLGNVVFGYTAESNRVEEENQLLRETVAQLRSELESFKRTPLMVCEFKEFFGEQGIIRIPNGNQFCVNISSDCEKIAPGDTVFVEQKNLTVVQRANSSRKFNVEKFVIIETPNVKWSDIGGMHEQINEIREVVEMPLKNPEMFEKIGIHPPKGVLLHGAPGTGKTMLAKAVATATNATFIEVVGSELVQKFIGEGANLVKEIFELAREKAPAIVFIDEIDALASKRMDVGTSGEREVQRTFMQLLAEIDGFKNLGNVKIIGCTNRKDILDSALVRPGRLERHIAFDVPSAEERREIFRIHSKQIRKARIDAEQLIEKMHEFSGADVKSVCTEAGYFAIRQGRDRVLQQDFLAAIAKVRKKQGEQDSEFASMFG